MIHNLKCDTEPFQAIWDGKKKCEIRVFNRLYKVGDTLKLQEVCADDTKGFIYTGRFVEADVTHIVPPGKWGLSNDVGVLSIQVTLKHQLSGEDNELASLSD